MHLGLWDLISMQVGQLSKNNLKTLVKKFHPDRNAGNKQFEDKLKKITLAYSHLKLIMIRK